MARRKQSFQMAANELLAKNELSELSDAEASDSPKLVSPISRQKKADESDYNDAEWSGKKSNILVSVRVRPMSRSERDTDQLDIIKVMDNRVVVILDPKKMTRFRDRVRGMLDPLRAKRTREKRYAFDYVFVRKSTQEQVFEKTTRFLTNGVLNGFNATVFAYGATGAGKTFTMLGTSQRPGCMFQTLVHMFSRIVYFSRAHRVRYTVKISMIEIYNEQIKDLLQPTGETLDLREDPIKGPTVSGMLEVVADSAEHVMQLLRRGNSKRTQEATKANKTSSRSHAVLQVVCEQKDINAGVSSAVKIGKLSMIDLAGSERASATNNRGQRLLEGANINRSLLALGNCINALVMGGKGAFVPYRDSKLTRLLKDSLGGNCRTVMIANISPAGKHFEETLNTLKYADRAKRIKTKVTRNVLNVNYHVSQYRALIGNLKKEISELKTELSRERKHAPPGISSLSSTANLREQRAVKQHGTRLADLFQERMQVRKSLIDLEAVIVQNRMQVRKSQLIIASTEQMDSDDRPATAAVTKARTNLKRQRSVLRQNIESQKELKKRVAEVEVNAKKLRKEMMGNITSEERQELMTLEVRMQTLELEKMDLERSRMMHKSELDEKDTLIQRLRMQLAARDNIIAQQREALESLGHNDRCLTAYQRLERLDTTSDMGRAAKKHRVGRAVAAADAATGDIFGHKSPHSHRGSPHKSHRGSPHKSSFVPTSLSDVDEDYKSPTRSYKSPTRKKPKKTNRRSTLAIAGGSIMNRGGRNRNGHPKHKTTGHKPSRRKANGRQKLGLELDDLSADTVMSPVLHKPPRSPVQTPKSGEAGEFALNETVRKDRHQTSPKNHKWADSVHHSMDSFDDDDDDGHNTDNEYSPKHKIKARTDGNVSDDGLYIGGKAHSTDNMRYHLKIREDRGAGKYPKARTDGNMSDEGASYRSKLNSDLEREIEAQLREINHKIHEKEHEKEHHHGASAAAAAARPRRDRRKKNKSKDRFEGGRHRRANGKRSNKRFQRQQQLRRAQAQALGVRGHARYNRK